MNALRRFRAVALLEGASFVVLLAIAMPLKYAAGMPLPTRIVGAVHGLLFLVFIAALIRVSAARRWSARRSVTAFVASLLPFGTFVFDRSLRAEIDTIDRQSDAVPTRG